MNHSNPSRRTARRGRPLALLLCGGLLLAALPASARGKPRLIRAVRTCELDKVKAILEKTEDIDNKGNRGWTALDLAVDKGHLEIAAMLRKAARG